MIREIKKNDKFVCIKDVVMDGEYDNIAYKVGNVYQSEIDNCLTNDQGNTSHFWTEGTGGYFIPYTYAAISAHYATLKDMDEADPFAMLLLDLEPTVERVHEPERSEPCSCGEHSPNGIYAKTTMYAEDSKTPLAEFIAKSPADRLAEMNIPDGPVTQEQIVAVDKMIAECNVKSTPDLNSTEGSLPTYYDNTNGSLYKIAEHRGWNFYQSDAVKRIDRALKKGQFKEDIEKTIALLNLWLEESK